MSHGIIIFTICLFLSLMTIGCDNENSSKTITSSENLIAFNESDLIALPQKYTGVVVVNYDNGNKWKNINYINGKKNGIEIWWYPNGQDKMSSHTFTDGILNGEAMKYNWGLLTCRGIYKDGKPWDGEFLENHWGDLIEGLGVNPGAGYAVQTCRVYKSGKHVGKALH